MQKQTAVIQKKRRSQKRSRLFRHHTGSQSLSFHLVRSCCLGMVLRLPRFRRLSMQHSYSPAQTWPADHRLNWIRKQIDRWLPASYARRKVKLHWLNWGWSTLFSFLCACLSIYGFCNSFQPELSCVCSETASAPPGGNVSRWRMCNVHFPPAVVAQSAPLL